MCVLIVKKIDNNYGGKILKVNNGEIHLVIAIKIQGTLFTMR